MRTSFSVAWGDRLAKSISKKQTQALVLRCSGACHVEILRKKKKSAATNNTSKWEENTNVFLSLASCELFSCTLYKTRKQKHRKSSLYHTSL